MNNVWRVLLFLMLGLGAAMQGHAQNTRSWVSGVGDDVNPCSRTAPCKTFAGAISKTSAGGEINCLDPGGFGAVTITKALTIDCSNGSGIAGVLASGTNGIIVNAGANDVVVLRNLDINGAASAAAGMGLNGIRYLAGRALHVENCTIYQFSQKGIDAALANVAGSHSLFVSNTKILNNLGAGQGAIVISTPAANTAVIDATITNTILQGNSRGLFVGDHAKVAVNNSTVTGNQGDGFVANGAAAATNAILFIDNSTASLNTATAVNAQTNATIRIAHMQISGNAVGMAFGGASSSLLSFGNNDVTGNVTNGNPSATISTL